MREKILTFIEKNSRIDVKELAILVGVDETVILNPMERVAQLIVTPYIPIEMEKVDELTDTNRGAGGFGSTGKV